MLGEAGTQLLCLGNWKVWAETWGRCGTSSPGKHYTSLKWEVKVPKKLSNYLLWYTGRMGGDHPTRLEGEVERIVHFPKYEGIKGPWFQDYFFFVDIKVLNCGKFMIYYLPDPFIDGYSHNRGWGEFNSKNISDSELQYMGYCTMD